MYQKDEQIFKTSSDKKNNKKRELWTIPHSGSSYAEVRVLVGLVVSVYVVAKLSPLAEELNERLSFCELDDTVSLSKRQLMFVLLP